MKKNSANVPIMPIEERTPVQLPGAFQFDRVSRDGRSYRIFVYVPPFVAPAQGFPILYMLDGNAAFATAVQAVALQMRRAEVTGVPASIIVGIGYPTEATFDLARRRFDYTPAPAGAAPDAESGGADLFLDFLEVQLKPTVEAMVPVDRQRQALFGHSFGGLLALWALFTRPGSFLSYVAASPSIWWKNRCVLRREEAFAEQMKRGMTDARLLVTVGSLERFQSGAGSNSEAKACMVEDASSLVARLASLGYDRLRAEFVEFADENHASVIPAAISRSVRFAWSK